MLPELGKDMEKEHNGAMYNVIGVGCRMCAETEKLGPLTVTGIHRNKRHNGISVMVGFKGISCE